MTNSIQLPHPYPVSYQRGSRRAEGSSCSICPANWHLPNSGGSNDEAGSFYNLLSKYSLTSSPTSGNNNIATSPLYFVRSGYVYPDASYLGSAGYSGRYWSGRADSSSYAYYLYFYSSSVSPSISYNRYNGYSVRCVAAR